MIHLTIIHELLFRAKKIQEKKLKSSRPTDFDQTLKVGSWDHFEQIPTVTVTFVQATFVLATFVHLRNISAVTDQNQQAVTTTMKTGTITTDYGF